MVVLSLAKRALSLEIEKSECKEGARMRESTVYVSSTDCPYA
jgi:hypothetical protein